MLSFHLFVIFILHDEAYHVGSPGKKTTHTRLPDSPYPKFLTP